MIRTMFARRLLAWTSILSCTVLLSFVATNEVSGDELNLPITEGPFQPTPESLEKYQYPDWFRDAKFGIWAHWGPQAVPMDGDWYARGMYEPGNKHYNTTWSTTATRRNLATRTSFRCGKLRNGILIA